MIHLAKFTGAPPSRAEELVTQIAAAVEGLSAVTWQESEISTATEGKNLKSRNHESWNSLVPEAVEPGS